MPKKVTRANRPTVTRGKSKVATGRVLAHQSRHSRTLSKSSKLKAGKAAASSLVKGTMEQNRAMRAKAFPKNKK